MSAYNQYIMEGLSSYPGNFNERIMEFLGSIGMPFENIGFALRRSYNEAASLTIPPYLSVSVSGDSASLSWTNPSSVSSFNLYRNGLQVATITGATIYQDSGLAVGSTYGYYVVPIVDGEEFAAGTSNTVAFTASTPIVLPFPTTEATSMGMFVRTELNEPEANTALSQQEFTVSAVNTGTNTITVSGLDAGTAGSVLNASGTQFVLESTGDLPAGYTAGQVIYPSPTSGDDYELFPIVSDIAEFESLDGMYDGDAPVAEAQNFKQQLNALSLTSAGSGTITLKTVRQTMPSWLDMSGNGINDEAITLSDIHYHLEVEEDADGFEYIPIRATVRDEQTNFDSRAGKFWQQGPDAKRLEARGYPAGTRTDAWTIVCKSPAEPELVTGCLKAYVSSVSTSNGEFTSSNHSLLTGDSVKIRVYADGVLPTGINDTTDYFARRITGSRFTLHPTESDATNNTNVIIPSTAGSAPMQAICDYRVGDSIVRARYLIEQLAPDSASNTNSPLVQDFRFASYIGDVSIFNTGTVTVGGPGKKIVGNDNGDRIYIWFPPGSVRPVRTDTGQALEDGYYYVSKAADATVFARIHDTQAEALSNADVADGSAGGITFTSIGSGEVSILSAWTDGDSLGVAIDGDATYDPIPDVRLPKDRCVITFLVDYLPDGESFAKMKIYLNGSVVADQLLTDRPAALLSETVLPGNPAWKLGNSSAGHVPAHIDMYAKVGSASTGIVEDRDVIAVHDYYIDKYQITQ